MLLHITNNTPDYPTLLYTSQTHQGTTHHKQHTRLPNPAVHITNTPGYYTSQTHQVITNKPGYPTLLYTSQTHHVTTHHKHTRLPNPAVHITNNTPGYYTSQTHQVTQPAVHIINTPGYYTPQTHQVTQPCCIHHKYTRVLHITNTPGYSTLLYSSQKMTDKPAPLQTPPECMYIIHQYFTRIYLSPMLYKSKSVTTYHKDKSPIVVLGISLFVNFCGTLPWFRCKRSKQGSADASAPEENKYSFMSPVLWQLLEKQLPAVVSAIAVSPSPSSPPPFHVFISHFFILFWTELHQFK